MRQVTSLRYYATVTSHEQEATEAKYVKVCQASFVLCCLGSEKVAMILLFWQVLGAHYEIAESVLSLEAVQDEIIWFIPHLHLHVVWTGLLLSTAFSWMIYMRILGWFLYRIAGYFRGVPIFVIFVVNRRDMYPIEFYDRVHVLYKVEQTRR